MVVICGSSQLAKCELWRCRWRWKEGEDDATEEEEEPWAIGDGREGGREVVAGCCRWVEEPPMCSACSNWMTETRGIGEEE